MIVAVCSDKGAPGVTTLAMVLGLCWPGGAPVLEADPSGGDLTFRLRPRDHPDQEFLAAQPSVFTLAADARTGLADGSLDRYAQPSTMGVSVIPAPLRAERFSTLRPMWAPIGAQLASMASTVIADLGRMQPGHPAWALAQAATAVLVLARPEPEGLYHVRERVAQLAHDLGDEGHSRNPVAVVMLTPAKDHRQVMSQVSIMLEAAGSPIPVVGWMAEDRAGVAAVRAGQMTRSVQRGDVLSSVGQLAASMIRIWPRLGPPAQAAERAGEARPLRVPVPGGTQTRGRWGR